MTCKECVHYEVCEYYLNEHGHSIVVPVGIIRDGLLGIMKTKCPVEFSKDEINRQKAEIERLQNYINSKLSSATSLIGAYDLEVAKAEAIKEEVKKFDDLLYIIRTNMTSITRYVRYERKEHPTLTDGQSLDRHLKYKELANVAVTNILEYVNGEPCKRNGG